MQDLAVLTDGQVVSEEFDVKLENVTIDQLGSCKNLTMSKDETVILGGHGSLASIQDRSDLIRDTIERTTSSYEIEKLQERLAKLSGGVAIIKVGGSSEVEVGAICCIPAIDCRSGRCLFHVGIDKGVIRNQALREKAIHIWQLEAKSPI